MKKLNILFVSRSIPLHHFGGMELVAWDLAVAFKEMGHTVNFLTTSLPNRPQVLTHDKIIVHALSNTTTGKYSSSWWKESSIYFQETLKPKTNIVLSISAGAYGLLEHKNHIPFVLQAHGTSWGEFISKLREKKIKSYIKSVFNLMALKKDLKTYDLFDAFVAVGEAVVQDTKKFPINRALKQNKVHLIKNGINTTLFSFNPDMREQLREKYNIDNSTKVVMSASRLHKQKGVHLGLLGFVEYLKVNPNSIYIIIGDGPEYKNLNELAKKLNIIDNVIFTGSLKREELAQYLNIGDIFLFTSQHNEGLPLNTLEALSSGLKVIVSSHIQGVLDINKNATIPVDPKSAQEISKALETEIDENRKSYLPEEYSLDCCAKQYIKLFYSLMEFAS